MKMKRIAALFLAALMIIPVFCVSARAADEVDIENYYSKEYTSQQAKVDTMELMYKSEEYGYAMYFDRKSGEFALQNLKTGEYTFSNPYDVAVNTKTNETHRQAIMSQVIVSYTDVETKTTSVLNSFKDAAMNGNQITFKTLTNGVRVEYAIGTVESKRLIPRQIEKSRFEEKIYNVLGWHHDVKCHFAILYRKCSTSVICFIYMKHGAVGIKFCTVSTVFKNFSF